MAGTVTGVEDGSGQLDSFARWRDALADTFSSSVGLMAWQDRRYSFAHKVGQLLAGAEPGGSPVTGHVVYGVYVAGSGLVYVGQTAEAQRRLRDLPVGESHHLATTVPPEIWDRVVVVQWPTLLSRLPAAERHTVGQLPLSTCGLAMEYLLQAAYQPVMSGRRRSTAGVWSPRNITSSRSRGAVASASLPSLFSHVRAHWDELATARRDGPAEPVTYSSTGRAVFPGNLLLPRQSRFVGTVHTRLDVRRVALTRRGSQQAPSWRRRGSPAIVALAVDLRGVVCGSCAQREPCLWRGTWQTPRPPALATGPQQPHSRTSQPPVAGNFG
jgi:hypothetical protein